MRIIRALYFEFGWLINSGILQVRYRYGMPTVVHLDDLTREERGTRPVPNIDDLDDIEPGTVFPAKVWERHLRDAQRIDEAVSDTLTSLGQNPAGSKSSGSSSSHQLPSHLKAAPPEPQGKAVLPKPQIKAPPAVLKGKGTPSPPPPSPPPALQEEESTGKAVLPEHWSLQDHLQAIDQLHQEYEEAIGAGCLQVRYRGGRPTMVHHEDLRGEELGQIPIPHLTAQHQIEHGTILPRELWRQWEMAALRAAFAHMPDVRPRTKEPQGKMGQEQGGASSSQSKAKIKRHPDVAVNPKLKRFPSPPPPPPPAPQQEVNPGKAVLPGQWVWMAEAELRILQELQATLQR